MASLLNEGAPTGGDLLVEQGAVPAAVRKDAGEGESWSRLGSQPCASGGAREVARRHYDRLLVWPTLRAAVSAFSGNGEGGQDGGRLSFPSARLSGERKREAEKTPRRALR